MDRVEGLGAGGGVCSASLQWLSPFSSPGLTESCSEPHSLLPTLKALGLTKEAARTSLLPCTAPKLRPSLFPTWRHRSRGKWEGKERKMGAMAAGDRPFWWSQRPCVQETCSWAAPRWTCYLENLPHFIRARDVCLQLPYRQPPSCRTYYNFIQFCRQILKRHLEKLIAYQGKDFIKVIF